MEELELSSWILILGHSGKREREREGGMGAGFETLFKCMLLFVMVTAELMCIYPNLLNSR